MSLPHVPFVTPLWDGPAPDAAGDGAADRPELPVFLPEPDRAKRAAVIICPGGGYGGLAFAKEGLRPAAWLCAHGYTAAVLRYRHSPYRHPVPLLDAQRALRLVRHRAEAWLAEPGRVGIMGHSAGGHLAATAGTDEGAGDPAAADPVDRIAARPDFLVLMYPVITFTGRAAHGGSARNLLGDPPDPQQLEALSMERRVTAHTPPTFLFHTSEDAGVPPQNSLLFYEALHRAGVPAELHVYEKGGHGIGMADMHPWTGALLAWLAARAGGVAASSA